MANPITGGDTTVLADLQDGICTLRMNRPGSLNACNSAMWRTLCIAFERIAADASIRSVVLTGEGRAFCVGADLKESVWDGETREASRARIDGHQQRLARLVVATPVPVVAAINGYALGGGLELALACDLRIAASTAQLGFPEASVGSSITGGASLLLPALVGLSAAKRMLFTGQRIDAGRALAIGLVDEVVEPRRVVDVALEVCRSIAANAPLSVRTMKSALHRVAYADLEGALREETERLVALYDSRDHDEGGRAFVERRAPRFLGR